MFWKKTPQKSHDLILASFDALDPSTEIPAFPIYLNSTLEKLLKIGSVHGAIFCGVGAVQGEPAPPHPSSFASINHKLFNRNQGNSRGKTTTTTTKGHAFIFIYLKGKVTEKGRGRVRKRSPVHLFTSQMAGVPHGWQGPHTGATFHCCPRRMSQGAGPKENQPGLNPAAREHTGIFQEDSLIV